MIYGTVANLQVHLVPPAQVAVIGTVPTNFNPVLTMYQRLDFVKLIIFYNEDFGILANDNLAASIEKFQHWLVTY